MLQGTEAIDVKITIAQIEGAVALIVAILGAVVALLNVGRTKNLARELENQKDTRERELAAAGSRHQKELAELEAKLSKQEQLFREAGPERALVLQHLVTTKELVHSTFSRFADFATSRSRLSPSEVLPQATDTLDLYADLHKHVKHHYVDSAYPKELKDAISRGQAHLASLFLDLQFVSTAAGDARSADQRIGDTLVELHKEKNIVADIVNTYTAVRLSLPRSPE